MYEQIGLEAPRAGLFLEDYASTVGLCDTLTPTDAEFARLSYGSSRRTGIIIGQACVGLANGDLIEADSLFAEVVDQCRDFTANPRNSVEREMRSYGIVASMMLERHDKDALENQRQMLHYHNVEEAVLALKIQRSSEDRRPEALSELAGVIAEKTIIALLSRQTDHNNMAIPALQHHDMTRDRDPEARTRNHDAILLSGDESYLLQIKLGCIGACCQERVGNSRIRERYSPDITLVSAECDLGIRLNRRREWTSPLTEMLLREAAGLATEEDMKCLDEATNKLLAKITANNDEHCGTWQEANTQTQLTLVAPEAFSS